MTLDINDIRSAITLASLVAFLGVVIWAYRPGRKSGFDEAARSVLDEADERATAGKTQGVQQ
jgi:cytochrome c oxidase cbb3-type subunit IV